jgi:hypothetical protein
MLITCGNGRWAVCSGALLRERRRGSDVRHLPSKRRADAGHGITTTRYSPAARVCAGELRWLTGEFYRQNIDLFDAWRLRQQLACFGHQRRGNLPGQMRLPS